MSEKEKRDSVTRKGHGFTVEASPLNPVKLELGIILVVSVLVWLVLERVLMDSGVLLLALFSYALLAMGWIIIRTRRVLRRLERRREEA